MPELSVLIPSLNEMFLRRTVEDILLHSEAETEIVVVLDGWETDLPESDRIKVIRHAEPHGQRASCNEAARMASSKYVMKVDAHCAFDQGFDRKMLEVMQDDWTMVPVMRNLHAFDWVCPNGHRRYQGPSGVCTVCGEPTTMDVVWIGKGNPQSTAYCFDSEPHFQYMGEMKKRPNGKGPLSETMSLQGSCYMCTKEKYFDLNLDDETFGSWGSQGLTVAITTWLSGGKCICNHNTWYAHLFRTQGGDFGFPYKQSDSQIQNAKQRARDTFFNNRHPKQIYPLSWLVEKFSPVPGWHVETKKVKIIKENVERVMKAGKLFNQAPAVIVDKPSIGLVYYSDGRPDKQILESCQRQIKVCCNGHDIVSVTLVPMDFGRNIVMNKERGYLTMFQQILKGIEESTADVLFMVEHDVGYHPSHFDFIPPNKEIFYYDENVWHINAFTGHALFYNHMSTSMLCGYRDALLKHYIARVEKVEKEGFTRRFGFEPGSHKPPRGCDYYTREAYFSKHPSLDIRHDKNLTSNRWRKRDFRNQQQLYAWTEKKVWELDGWTKDQLRGLLPNAIPN